MSLVDGFDFHSRTYVYEEMSWGSSGLIGGNLTYNASNGPYGEATISGDYRDSSTYPFVDSRMRMLSDVPAGSTIILGFHAQGDRRFGVRLYESSQTSYKEIDINLPLLGYNRPDDWHWICIKAQFGGNYTVRLNNTQILTGSMGVSGSAGQPWFTGQFKIANLHILDDSGSTYNDWLEEERRFARLVPNEDGNYDQWDALSGGDHHDEILETDADGDTSYIQESAAGYKDSFKFTDLPSVINIRPDAVKVDLIGKKTDVAATQVKMFRRAAGADSDLNTVTFLANYSRFNYVLGALTESECNALELGLEVVSA